MKKEASFQKCVEVARLQFENYFNYQIANLLHMFPHDALDKDGHPFWSGPKRAPTPIPYNPNDPLHAQFITACANLVAFNLGVAENRNEQEVALMAVNVVVPEFKFKVIKVELPGQAP